MPSPPSAGALDDAADVAGAGASQFRTTPPHPGESHFAKRSRSSVIAYGFAASPVFDDGGGSWSQEVLMPDKGLVKLILKRTKFTNTKTRNRETKLFLFSCLSCFRVSCSSWF